MQTNTAIYPIPGFPMVFHTADRASITIRPMLPTDEEALLGFFRRISLEDRQYLKADVTSPEVIARWAENLDYRRVLPLLALRDGRIIGDGTLHHTRAGARRHIGEVRIVMDPAYRNQGIGRALLKSLVDVAKGEDRELEKIVFEVVADTEEAAQHTARALGFKPVAVFSAHVRYFGGVPHDLVVMELQLATTIADPAADDPATFMF